MARFMTREVEGIFKKLREEMLGMPCSFGVATERWCWKHDGFKHNPVKVSITLFDPWGGNEALHSDKYSSVEVMVGEALAKIREWKEEEDV